MSDEPLTQEHLTALEGLLGHSIEDQPEQRFRAIHELLDRHGTGRILFRNTREAIQGFLAVIANLRLYLRQQIGQKMVNYASKCAEEAQIDGSWMQNDPRVPWLMEILRKELKHKKFF